MYGSYGILETGFPLSSIIPYYNVLKLVMFIYLYHSTTKGATMVSARARQRGRVGTRSSFAVAALCCLLFCAKISVGAWAVCCLPFFAPKIARVV